MTLYHSMNEKTMILNKKYAKAYKNLQKQKEFTYKKTNLYVIDN